MDIHEDFAAIFQRKTFAGKHFKVETALKKKKRKKKTYYLYRVASSEKKVGYKYFDALVILLKMYLFPLIMLMSSEDLG